MQPGYSQLCRLAVEIGASDKGPVGCREETVLLAVEFAALEQAAEAPLSTTNSKVDARFGPGVSEGLSGFTALRRGGLRSRSRESQSCDSAPIFRL